MFFKFCQKVSQIKFTWYTPAEWWLCMEKLLIMPWYFSSKYIFLFLLETWKINIITFSHYFQWTIHRLTQKSNKNGYDRYLCEKSGGMVAIGVCKFSLQFYCRTFLWYIGWRLSKVYTRLNKIKNHILQ